MRILVFAAFAATTAAASGCANECRPRVSNQTTVQQTPFSADIQACQTQGTCFSLCRDVFKISATDIVSCEIQKMGPSTVTVRVIVSDPARCEAGADDVYLDWGDDTGYEDASGCDDDSCDDGSTDDGSTDGSTDDGGSTDGGSTDGGSTDDGGDGSTDAAHVAAHRPIVVAPHR
jgi:hypothetical protein